MFDTDYVTFDMCPHCRVYISAHNYSTFKIKKPFWHANGRALQIWKLNRMIWAMWAFEPLSIIAIDWIQTMNAIGYVLLKITMLMNLLTPNVEIFYLIYSSKIRTKIKPSIPMFTFYRFGQRQKLQIYELQIIGWHEKYYFFQIN